MKKVPFQVDSLKHKSTNLAMHVRYFLRQKMKNLPFQGRGHATVLLQRINNDDKEPISFADLTLSTSSY